MLKRDRRRKVTTEARAARSVIDSWLVLAVSASLEAEVDFSQSFQLELNLLELYPDTERQDGLEGGFLS